MTAESATAVALRQVTKRFGEKIAVSDLSLRIPKRSLFGLIGPNGAGKTTTFSMMCGYILPNAGSVKVLDRGPADIAALRGKVGVLPQDAILPQRETVGEFLISMAVLQGLPERESAAKKVLAEVGGSDWWHRRAFELSHGMSKRVSLAQAFLGAPEVLFLDEPTAGLDPKSAHEIRDLITKRRGEATIVISSHNLHELEEICDRAAILDRGVLVASGTIAELSGATSAVVFSISRALLADERSKLEAFDGLTRIEWQGEEDSSSNTGGALQVFFNPETTTSEKVIRLVARSLFDLEIGVRAITPGLGLERRVMDLTE
ncbi:MAG: ABC transporter ATP-binding protein [Polyangiaceae bacterium]|nr:ABC transporter ATP-binding protein [Polyangiaceae bacterium]